MPNHLAQVDTGYGAVRGIHRNGLFEFKGIPFAAPPIAERRWLPPAPPLPWSGILDATSFGPAAPQINRPVGIVRMPGSEEIKDQSENCLFLNIWTPGVDNYKRPVMVWIYGGGFTAGSGALSCYHGDVLATRGNVVLVTINHRLGLLGFLNLNEVTHGEIPATGNEGLQDQLAALKWVKENIAAFGGDPANVTVFGESSGAMSIGCLLGMPSARGLFDKAILESGTGKMSRPLAVCVQTAQLFLKAAGIKNNYAKALREITVERLLAIQQDLTLQAPGGVTPAAPVVDGRVLPDVPVELVRSGDGVNVPILIGHNSEELKISFIRQPSMVSMDESTLSDLCRTLVPPAKVSRLIESYRAARREKDQPVSPAELFSAMRTDAMFSMPIIQLLDAVEKNGQQAYNYLFTWKSPAMGGILGALHSLEIGFVFGHLDSEFHGYGPAAEDLSYKIQDAWLAFARNGNPGCARLGDWPAYGQSRRTMELGVRCGIMEAVFDAEKKIWEEIGESGQV
jgi:para-nitrobenzyl esterase